MPDYVYQSRVRLDPAWPGVHASGEGLQVDPETLARIGRSLSGQAGGLSADPGYLPTGLSYFDDSRRSGTVGLDRSTSMPEGEHWFGQWPTALLMEHSLATAQSAIVHYHRALVEQVAAAGRLFTATSDDYRDDDRATAVADLPERVAGWEQVAADPRPLTGAPAGLLRETAAVPYVDQYEDVSEYDPQWIIEQVEVLRAGQPWTRLHSAGDGFAVAAESLTSLATLVRGHAGALAAEWDSDTSAACQRALQRITATAEHLAEAATDLASYSHRCAEALQETVSAFPTEVEGRNLGEWLQDAVTIGDDPNRNARMDEVRDALARLNDTYRTINYTTLPAEIGAHLPLLPKPLNDDGFDDPHEYSSPDRPSLPSPPLTPSPPIAGTGGSTLPVGTGITGFPGVGSETSADGGSRPGGGSATSEMPVGPGGLAGAVGAQAAGTTPPGLGSGSATPGVVGPGAAGGAGPGGGGLPPAGVGVVPRGAYPGSRTGAGGSGTGGRGLPGAASGPAGRPPAGGIVTTGGPGAQSGGRAAWRPSPGRTTVGATPYGVGTATGRAGGRAAPHSGMLPTATSRRDDQESGSDPDSWLVEDDDPWRGEIDAPPPVIR